LPSDVAVPATRVLWLTKGLGPGGAERLLVNLAGALDPDRTQATAAYLLPWKDHLVPELEALGVPATCLSNGRTWDLRWIPRLLRLVRRERIDVLHLHSPVSASLARVAARALGRRRPAVVYTEHNNWQSYSWPTRAIHRLTFALDDLDVAVSDEARDSIPRRWRSKVEVVVHGVPLEPLRSLAGERAGVRSELGIGDDEVLVVTVANYRKDKDYPTLLEAAALVAEDPALGHVRFVAVGQGPLAAEIEARLDRLDLGDRFRLLGYRPDAARVLAGGDVFALSSTNEGYPVALMEALALGLPVVATGVGGVKVAIRDGVEGLLVAPGSPSDLAAALTRISSDPQLRSQMSAAAAARGEDYSITRSAARLADVYDEARHARSA
jgi:glycosyltransferase involved in cell wall biosynthesis